MLQSFLLLMKGVDQSLPPSFCWSEAQSEIKIIFCLCFDPLPVFRGKNCDRLKEKKNNETHPKGNLVKHLKNDILMEENSTVIFIFQKKKNSLAFEKKNYLSWVGKYPNYAQPILQ